MAFKTICEKCGAQGRIFRKKGVDSAFFWALRSEGAMKISHDDDEIAFECKNCDNKIAD